MTFLFIFRDYQNLTRTLSQIIYKTRKNFSFKILWPERLFFFLIGIFKSSCQKRRKILEGGGGYEFCPNISLSAAMISWLCYRPSLSGGEEHFWVQDPPKHRYVFDSFSIEFINICQNLSKPPSHPTIPASMEREKDDFGREFNGSNRTHIHILHEYIDKNRI